MRISVVIPVKNRVPKLIDAINSAVAIRNVCEVIVVDDHSTPPLTLDALNLQERSNLVRIVRNSGSPGAQHARSLGTAEAVGDFVLYLDSDDLLVAAGIEEMIAASEKNPDAALFYGNFRVGSKETNFLQVRGGAFPKLLKNLSLCPFSGLLVKKEAAQWDDVDKDLPAWQDDDFCLTVARRYPVYFVDTITAEYKPSDDSISASTDKRLIGLRGMLRKWGPEMKRIVGHRCYFVWKLMYFALWAETIMATRRRRGISKKSPVNVLLKFFSKRARAVSRQYLDVLHV
ncbi:glycosyltransferase family 2 protein [Agrobacterium larrymoorei]|uniref:glycosyltransferase family 2 protein n=1 Tax=Agrobacterium larrymoorei TaxID=160699 RepID=UPI0030C45E45